MRRALIDASTRTIYRLGYGGATTALIAEEAGVSRGALTHHFATRAELMAEVLRDVFEQERSEYEAATAETHAGLHASDWPAMLWRAFSRPSGFAVLEILQAARSDAELSERVKETQQSIEDVASSIMDARFGLKVSSEALDEMRLVVWAVRGLSIAQVLLKEPEEINRSVDLLSRVLRAAEEAGVFHKRSDSGRGSHLSD
jgi:AcrR family transcriptional regulator